MSDMDDNADTKDKDGFSIELGDIIQIISPRNPELDANAFYVMYVDSSKIKMVNINTYVLVLLTIDESGAITDESITEIHLLTRSMESGFARQNGLLPKTWIDIHFGGEMPYIATGEITNLEEDMIEIKTLENDVFYIDFEYKGVPEHIPIDKIVIRDPPAAALATASAVDTNETLYDALSANKPSSEATIEYTENGESIINIPEGTVADATLKDVLHEIYLDANELYGEDLEEIFQNVEIPEYQKKYTIETQVNDFMDELLSTVPNSRRTAQLMAKIHNLVERFKELRNMYSVFDETGNVVGKKVYGDLHKPLIERILNLDTRLRWLIPVVKQTKKLYVEEEEGEKAQTSIAEDAPDAVILNTGEELTNESILYDNYYKNISVGNENKYDALQSRLYPFQVPFLPPTSQDSLLAFKQSVMQDIDAIVQEYSSTIQPSKTQTNKVNQFKHMVQRYNMGTYIAAGTEMKGGVKVSVKMPLSPPDKMSVSSLFMMPHSVIKYSHVDLPGTNIMMRSQLSQKQLDLFRIFNSSSQFAVKFVDDLTKEIQDAAEEGKSTEDGAVEEGKRKKFAKRITEYQLDSSLQNEDDKFRKMLDVIIPKTRTLIKLMQPYMSSSGHSGMSLVDMVSLLEPFMVYPENITYGQYNEIRYHIKQQILEFKKDIAKKSKDFKSFSKKDYNNNKELNTIDNILNFYGSRRETEVVGSVEAVYKDHYGTATDKSSATSKSSSEMLNSILNKDYGALFCNLLTYTLLSLITPNKLMDSLAEFNIPDTSEDIRIRNECGTRYLTKKYASLSDLQKDNNGVAYWDKEYDDTPYSILSKYSEDKEKMLPEKFITFLAENLVQKHDCPREKSVELANTLIRGKKKVGDGEYAVVELETGNKKDADKDTTSKYYHYYVRKDGHWVRDNSIDENSFIDTPALFCNVSEKCYYNTSKDTCEYGKDTQIRMKKLVSEGALKALDQKFAITVEELKGELEKNILSLATLIKHKNVLSESLLYKENNVAYNIGKYAVKHDMIQSPHLLLRDLILSQDDFIKKQQDICKFVAMFCREPILDNGEEIHWKYCIQTNVKLFPSSLYILASTFIAGEDYASKQEELCYHVGQLSDDGDAIVDKYSGYVLKAMDFVNEETYDESGFKITTHGILEKDIGALAAEVLTKKKDTDKVFENETSEMVYNVFHSLCGNMGIDPTNHEEFVMRVSLEFINNKDIVLSQGAYEKRTEKLEKQKGKVSAPYVIYRNQILITCVAALTLVSIQSSLESVRPRKTFPGCVYSFGGYPFDGGIESVAGIKYVACVIGKTKSSIVPWNSVEKLTDAILAKRIRDFLETYVVIRSDISDMFVRKREYLVLHPDDAIPNIHNVSMKWKQFLPPLHPVSVSSSLHGTSKEFDDETVKLMQHGNHGQQTHYNVYKSKIIQHTYGIVELINNNVREKDVLMKTMSKVPYLENACCNEADMRLNPIQYFISEDKNIDLYVKRSAKCEMIANRMRVLTQSPYLFNKENTRFVYPEINDNFYEKEQHAYHAFIHYCNFDNDLPIPDDLLPLVREKPSGYDKHASLEEKIEFLKKVGMRYTSADLSHLMRIVNARNIQTLVPPKTVVPVAMLLDFLENMVQKNSTVIEDPLRKKLRDVLLEYKPNVMIHDKDTEITPFMKATAVLRKYLTMANTKMHERVMEYIDSYGNLSTLKYNKIQDSILNLFKWTSASAAAADGTRGASDDLYHISGFFKTFIYNLTKVYPETLLQQNKTSHVFLSEFWGFSKQHMTDIEREIKKYMDPMEKFKNRKMLHTLMTYVPSWANDIYLFSQLIPVQTPIVKDGETFYGLFHKDTLHMLYMYCVYSSLYEYIQLSDDADLMAVDISYAKNKRRERNIENMEEATEGMRVVSVAGEGADVDEYVSEIDNIVLGDKEDLKNSVCAFLITCIECAQYDKNIIDKKYEDIVRSMKRTREQEKQSIIRLLEDTENNDPKIEKMLKKHKLGRWNIGNQSSLFKYSKDAYDRERVEDADTSLFEMAEPQAYDIEDLERMANAEIDAEHDVEGVDISGLDEEYYNGAYYPEDIPSDDL